VKQLCFDAVAVLCILSFIPPRAPLCGGDFRPGNAIRAPGFYASLLVEVFGYVTRV